MRHNPRMPTSNDRDSDPFHPPKTPVEVHCLHCGREYESYLIYWEERETKDGMRGFWCCPTPGCDGLGFGFDIFPTDPEYRDEEGNLMWCQDEGDCEEEGLDGAEEFGAPNEAGDDRKNGNGSSGNGRDALDDDIPY